MQDDAWKARPNIISFGLGQADAKVIGAIGTVKAYMTHEGGSSAKAIKEFTRKLTQSIVQSGRQQKPELVPPTSLDGADEVSSGIPLDEV